MRQNIQSLTVKPEELSGHLDEVARQGAQKMLRMALELEVETYVDQMKGVRTPGGGTVLVRNGYNPTRKIATGVGPVEVSVPRTRNKLGVDENFKSSLIPAYMRRSLTIDETIPLLYLRGLSTGDFLPALEKLLGPEVSGLSAVNISRLKGIWKPEYEAWQKRDLSDRQYCYVWVDGIHFRIRIGDDRLCILVAIGAKADGHKELLAVVPGYRESSSSWATLLRDLKERGLPDPKLFIGDGALGFWKAVGDVYPKADHQRCWVHKTANVLDKLPKSVQPQAKRMIHEIYKAPDKKIALKNWDKFITVFEAKYSDAVSCLEKNKEELLTFYNYPAAHWKHMRSTNVIESTFSTVRLRTKKTRGQGNESTTLLMVFKLLDQASKRWQRLSAQELILKVMEGTKFRDGLELKEAA